MKVKTRVIGILIIVSLLLFSMPPALGQVNYDIGYTDPEDDLLVDIEGSPSTDFSMDDFDIIQVESYKQTLKQDIILELTVVGEIIDDENAFYIFTILDDEEMVYQVVYCNVSCTGYNMVTYDESDDTLEASIENTDTLVVTLPIKNLGYISNYDFYGEVYAMFSDDNYYAYYEDYAPDQDWDDDYNDYYEKMIYITEPFNRSTVFGQYQMNGILNNYEADMESVEVQIDSQSSGGWVLATISEDGYTWSYDWDTTDFTDGSHSIYARGFDGYEYYNDEIVVQIDQSCATSPPTMERLELNIGDKFEYRESDFDEYFISSNGIMTLEVEGIEEVTVNNQVQETYIVAMNTENEMDDGDYYSKSTSTGKIWMRTSDLAFVKVDIYDYNTDIDSEGETSQSSSHSIIINDPPDRSLQFPVAVGERWERETEVAYDSTYTYDGETDSDNYVEFKITLIECLTTENVTVPAGTYDTFLLNFRDIYEDTYDEYPDDYENYNDMDGDDFPDDMEEDLGTDPDDPEDYPDFGDGGDDNGGNGDYVSNEVISTESYFDYYSIEYYSPEIGFFIKMETYDENRQLMTVMELTSYTPGKNEASGSSGVSSSGSSYKFEGQSVVLFVVLLIGILIIIAALFIRREHKKNYIKFEVEPLDNDSEEAYFSKQEQMEPRDPPKAV